MPASQLMRIYAILFVCRDNRKPCPSSRSSWPTSGNLSSCKRKSRSVLYPTPSNQTFPPSSCTKWDVFPGAAGQGSEERGQDRYGQPREGLLAGLPASAGLPQLPGEPALSQPCSREQRVLFLLLVGNDPGDGTGGGRRDGVPIHRPSETMEELPRAQSRGTLDTSPSRIFFIHSGSPPSHILGLSLSLFFPFIRGGLRLLDGAWEQSIVL